MNMQERHKNMLLPELCVTSEEVLTSSMSNDGTAILLCTTLSTRLTASFNNFLPAIPAGYREKVHDEVRQTYND